MPGKSVLDRYSQWAYLSVLATNSTSATVVAQLSTGITNLQKVAWAVDRVDYWVHPNIYFRLTANTNLFSIGITASSSTSQALELSNPSLYDVMTAGLVQTPAALGGPFIEHTPVSHIYQVGTELLVLPQNLYIAAYWSTTGAMAGTERFAARIHYKEVELGPEDWYDLLQMRMPLGAT